MIQLCANHAGLGESEGLLALFVVSEVPAGGLCENRPTLTGYTHNICTVAQLCVTCVLTKLVRTKLAVLSAPA